MRKVVASAEEAIQDVFDGAVIMVGGFGLCGNPENLIRALVAKGVKNLTTISNNAGADGWGVGLLLANGQIKRHIGSLVAETKTTEGIVLAGTVPLDLPTISNNAGVDGLGVGLLLANGQIKRHIGSYVGENKLLERMVLDGTVQLDLNPQGTLSERIRAGGAGIPAFFTPTGVGTVVADGKETSEFDGRTYIMERGLQAGFAFVKAWKGDKWGNLVYRKTARNFNPMMATAARITIAEVEHLVEAG